MHRRFGEIAVFLGLCSEKDRDNAINQKQLHGGRVGAYLYPGQPGKVRFVMWFQHVLHNVDTCIPDDADGMGESPFDPTTQLIAYLTNDRRHSGQQRKLHTPKQLYVGKPQSHSRLLAYFVELLAGIVPLLPVMIATVFFRHFYFFTDGADVANGAAWALAIATIIWTMFHVPRHTSGSVWIWKVLPVSLLSLVGILSTLITLVFEISKVLNINCYDYVSVTAIWVLLLASFIAGVISFGASLVSTSIVTPTEILLDGQ